MEKTVDAKEDLFELLNANEDRFEELKSAVTGGRINGIWSNISISTKCGCIKAHLGVKMSYPGTPIEWFISSVRTGETPTTSPVLKTVMAWLEEWESSRWCDF